MPPLAVGAPPIVSEIRDAAGFAALAGEWDRLLAETSDELFYTHGFIATWLGAFAPDARIRVLVARDADGRLEAVLPLISRRGLVVGLPARQLLAPANDHSCRFDLIARPGSAAPEAFVAHLAQDPSWDMLRLTDVPEEGHGWAVHEAARRRGMPVATWESLASPYIPLPPAFAGLHGRVSAKFRANCRRRRGKLASRGRLSVECYRGGGGDAVLSAKLAEGFALEASGWKGRAGTAIAQDERTRAFYEGLARVADRRGELALYFLRVDGRAVAFQYGVIHGGRYLLLKPGYDETLADCSPGQLLMEDVVRDCIDRKLSELDFLGPDMPWKREWTDRVRRHTWLYCFRNAPLGRALYRVRFRWAPAVKRAIARWRR